MLRRLVCLKRWNHFISKGILRSMKVDVGQRKFSHAKQTSLLETSQPFYFNGDPVLNEGGCLLY
jgi:hypothetical protein